jgi:hypothetical protein
VRHAPSIRTAPWKILGLQRLGGLVVADSSDDTELVALTARDCQQSARALERLDEGLLNCEKVFAW